MKEIMINICSALGTSIVIFIIAVLLYKVLKIIALYKKKEKRKKFLEHRIKNSKITSSFLYNNTINELCTTYKKGNIIFISENKEYLEEISILYSNIRFQDVFPFILNDYISPKSKIDSLITNILVKFKIIKSYILIPAIGNFLGFEERFNDTIDETIKLEFVNQKCNNDNIGILLFNLGELTFEKEYNIIRKLIGTVQSVVITCNKYSNDINIFKGESNICKIPNQDFFAHTINYLNKINYVKYKGSEYIKLNKPIGNTNELIKLLFENSDKDLFIDSYELSQAVNYPRKELIKDINSYLSLYDKGDLFHGKIKDITRSKIKSKLNILSDKQNHLNILFLLSKIPISVYKLDLQKFMEFNKYDLSIINDLEFLSLIEVTNSNRYVNWFFEINLSRELNESLTIHYFINNINIKIDNNGDLIYPISQNIWDCPAIMKRVIEQALMNRFTKKEGLYCNDIFSEVMGDSSNLKFNKNIHIDFIRFLSTKTSKEKNLRKNLYLRFLQKRFNLEKTFTKKDILEFSDIQKFKQSTEKIFYYSILLRKKYEVCISSYDKYMNDFGIYDYFFKTIGVGYSIANDSEDKKRLNFKEINIDV